MTIIRSKNDETRPESTVSTLRNCSREQINMIKFRVTEGARMRRTGSCFLGEPFVVNGPLRLARSGWAGAGG